MGVNGEICMNTKRPYWKVIVSLGLSLFGTVLFIVIGYKALVFFMPFVIGWLISSIASPVVSLLEKKLKITRKLGSALIIVAVLGGIVFLVYLIISNLWREVETLISNMPSMYKDLETGFREIGSGMEGIFRMLPEEAQETIGSVIGKLDEQAGNIVGRFSEPTVNAAGRFAKKIPSILIGIIVTFISAYFFIEDRDEVLHNAKRIAPDPIVIRMTMVCDNLKYAVGGYFKAQFKIECWIYVMLVIGLLILKVRYVPLVALGIAFLDFLPVFGTGTVMIPWAVIEILGNDYQMAMGLLIIWVAGQLVRQIIQPKIVGDSIGMEPIPTLFLLFIGYKVAGVMGMILAVPIGIIIVNLYEEGVFDTTKQSIQILVAGFNKFRRIRPEDIAIVEEYEREVETNYQRNLKNAREEERELEEASKIRIEEPLIIKKIISKKK